MNKKSVLGRETESINDSSNTQLIKRSQICIMPGNTEANFSFEPFAFIYMCISFCIQSSKGWSALLKFILKKIDENLIYTYDITSLNLSSESLNPCIFMRSHLDIKWIFLESSKYHWVGKTGTLVCMYQRKKHLAWEYNKNLLFPRRYLWYLFLISDSKIIYRVMIWSLIYQQSVVWL